MPDTNSDEFDHSSTSFTTPRAVQRLLQRERGHTSSSSMSYDSDTNSTESQRTARNFPATPPVHQPSQGTPEVLPNGILDRGRPVPSVFSKFEVVQCPEPSVPGGPSKPAKEQISRNNSDIPQSIRDQALEFVRQTNMRGRSTSPMLEHPPTMSENSLYEQASIQDSSKERPGFFRRVFGSSSRTASFQDQQRSNARDASLQSSVSTASSIAPARTQPASPELAQNVITKKPSFFRRRKKSASDATSTPPLPNLHIAASHLSDQSSPTSPGVSSLRKVMGQYLDYSATPTKGRTASTGSRLGRGSVTSHGTDDGDDDDELDMFHSGYTSPPDASIRVVEPMESQAASTKSLTPSAQQQPFTSPKLGDVDRRAAAANQTLQVTPAFYQRNNFLAGGNYADYGRKPASIISALSDSYVGGAGDAFSPVSPMDISPMLTPDERDVTSAQLSYVSPDLPRHGLGIPIEDITSSQSYLSSDPESHLPSFQVDGHSVRPSVEVARGMYGIVEEPTADEREQARQIYHGEEQNMLKDEAASWLGEKNPTSARTLLAYMDLFDFAGRNILGGLRALCDRLVLKGESQQVDRILDVFSHRWDECNPLNGLKGPGVVHAICYALLLLNTDQHMADIQHKMTRSEFVKNTMPAVKEAAGTVSMKPSRSTSRPSLPWSDSVPVLADEDEISPVDLKISAKRLSFRPALSRFETDPGPGENGEFGSANHLVNRPFEGPEHKWLIEVESLLKQFYNSIVSSPLPLHGSQNSRELNSSLYGPGNLSAANGTLRRTGSIISKAPSEGPSYRSRVVPTSALTSHWNAKTRPRQKGYPASTVGSTRTSIDDNQSAWSPSGQSSMWSKMSMGRTQTTMSVESFAVHPDFKQSLGFTNALSQAAIREESAGDTESVMKFGAVLEDESLELAGAPWAKEGMIKHKHHLDGPDKKSKERSWTECFAVVEKGYLHLFNFNRTTTKITSVRSTKRQPAKSGKAASITPSVVGGGNWTDNADETDQFLLRQSLATVLPAPGYSKTRPHVWALSLPTGAVHLFNVGTPEIAEEFVSTVNYWSARLSKEPLVGGVDNIEYGWSDNIINPALIGNGDGEPLSKPMSRAGGQHTHSNSITSTSHQSMSVRSSLDHAFGSRTRTPGDRAHINDWKPPAASMLPSQLLEIDQLRSLSAYVASVENELERHNELRSAVSLAYTNRHGQNWNKVMANWEKKSAYLLGEVVKFRTYIEALDKAVVSREKVYEERQLREQERAALGS
jgi:hypothetical protein